MHYLCRFKPLAPRVLSVVALAAMFAPMATNHSYGSPNGRSVRRAAQLKQAAPGWLSHYLPDDRYKIEGKVWKYVSTDLDTYYHRPDSPNMLRQSAERVIGFASAKDAEEAGYKPDPSDGTAAMAASSDMGAMGGAGSIGGMGGSLSKGGVTTLSDGVSKINLPKGWTRIGTRPRAASGATFSFDILTHPQSKGMVMIGILTQPGVNLGQQLSARQFGNGIAAISRAGANGRLNSQAGQDITNWANNARATNVTWGGLRGISVTPPANVGPTSGNLVMVAKGSKMYLYMAGKQGGGVAPGTKALLSSFKPR